MNVVIVSCGPGLSRVVEKYGHSSSWIPLVINNKKINFIVKKAYEYEKMSFDEADAWIITGSKYSVYDKIPWIISLEKFIKELIKRNKYILGLCFGHQIIAKSLGGIVIKNKLGWELGSYRILLTPDGKLSALFNNFYNNDIVYESHQDVVSKLPKGAVELAFSKKSNQSYRYTKYVYGVQFHPEFSYKVIRELMDIRIEKGIKVDDNNLNKSLNGNHILSNFINIVKGDE